MSSSQDLHSDTMKSPEPSSEPDQPTQLQLDPVTLSQVLTGAITLAQSSGPSVSNKNKTSNSKMPRKSKAAQTKPRSPRKSKSKKSKKTKSNDDSSQNEDEKANKTSQHWDNDDNGQGKSSMYLLLNWLTDEENFSRFKDNKSEKRGVAEDIERYMIENGITWRNAETIRKKIGREEEAWQKADALRNRTGQGSWMSATEMKAAKGWADDDPEWLKVKKVALAPILKRSKFFFELEPIFGTRHANVRLAAAHGLPATIDEDIGSQVQLERDAREHSVNSNLAYEGNDNGLSQNVMDESISSNLLNDEINTRPNSPTMDDYRNILNENHHENEDDHVPYTPTPTFRPRDSSQIQSQSQISSSLKRSSSKNSLDSGSQMTFNKNKRGRVSGSASSIQGLLQDKNVRSTPAQAETASNSIEHQAFIQHGQTMERLAHVFENVGTSVFGQQPTQSVLTPAEIKEKSRIEMEMANVKLSSEKFDLDSRQEKHRLEMEHMKAELEHQEVIRNAKLISTLMTEHGLSIEQAMLAAQHAQAMKPKPSNSNDSNKT